MRNEDIDNVTIGILEDISMRKSLLVSFGGIHQGLGIPLFEFFNSISDLDCDKVFIRDFNQAWYQNGIDQELDTLDKIVSYLRTLINNHAYDRVCFIGNSMGGYAAMLFGSILEVDNVVAFAPQTFIDCFNKLVYFDLRWLKELCRVYLLKSKKVEYFDLKKFLINQKSLKTRIDLYYSTMERLDKIHCERLLDIRNVNLHPLLKGGHAVVKDLRDTGQLKLIIQSKIETNSVVFTI